MSIELMQDFAAKFAREGAETTPGARVEPGQDFIVDGRLSVGDVVAQGDLYCQVVEEVPVDLVPWKPISQLVPGNTVGARHCLRDVSTVQDFAVPIGWASDVSYEGLLGPAFRAREDTTIEHPTHGDLHIRAGMCVRLGYQRNYDVEQERERRARD